MRWLYGRFLIPCALLVWSGVAHADDAASVAALTEQLKASSISATERIRLLFERGLAHDRRSELDEAIADYSAILDMEPNNAAALNNRANAYRRQGQLLDAKRDYLASLVAGNPRPAYSEYGLGQIAEAQGDMAGARDHYRRALASAPGYTLASQRLAALGPDELFSTIHLIPPAGGGDPDQIVLRPPPVRSVTLPQPQPKKSGWTRVAEARPPKNTDVSLRPTIPEGKGRPKPYKATGTQQVQLGAWRTRAEADAGLAKAQKVAGAVLAGVRTEIVQADIPGKGRYFRLRAGPSSLSEARRLCASLKGLGITCILAPH